MVTMMGLSFRSLSSIDDHFLQITADWVSLCARSASLSMNP